MTIVSLLQNAAAGAAGSANPLMSFAPIPIIIVIFYFFMIRPQSKKQKETEKMLKALKKGDKVVTIGGIHGTVSSTKEKTVIVKVDDGTKIEFNRSAIAGVLSDEKPAEKKSEKKAEEEKKAVEEKPAEASSENAENK